MQYFYECTNLYIIKDLYKTAIVCVSRYFITLKEKQYWNSK